MKCEWCGKDEAIEQSNGRFACWACIDKALAALPQKPKDAGVERCEVIRTRFWLEFTRKGGSIWPIAAAQSDPDFIAYEFADGDTSALPRQGVQADGVAEAPVAVLFRARAS